MADAMVVGSRMADAEGAVFAVSVGSRLKVGFSRDVAGRLKFFGANAGGHRPELVCLWPRQSRLTARFVNSSLRELPEHLSGDWYSDTARLRDLLIRLSKLEKWSSTHRETKHLPGVGAWEMLTATVDLWLLDDVGRVEKWRALGPLLGGGA